MDLSLFEIITGSDLEDKAYVCVKSLSLLKRQDQLLLTISAERFSDPTTREKLAQITKKKANKEILANTFMDNSNKRVSVTCLYEEDKLKKLGENHSGAIRRIQSLHNKSPTSQRSPLKWTSTSRGYVQINLDEARQNNHQMHFVGYNFIVLSTSSSTKVRMTTDSSNKTKTCLSLNEVTKPVPGDVPSLCGILTRSWCSDFFAVYNIRKFFRSVRISNKDSYLRIVCVPQNPFSSSPLSSPSLIYYRDCAIPFGDSASGDFAAGAKTATVYSYICDSPKEMQKDILQAILEDSYSWQPSCRSRLWGKTCDLQDEISKILHKWGFTIKSWENSSEDGESKYLRMFWNRKDDRYKLKFQLNLHKKFLGIPSGEDLDSAFLQDKMIPITRKNVLSVACQF